jgi:RNA polymerase subunit RPABC4/transcription elongation factor Spt4
VLERATTVWIGLLVIIELEAIRRYDVQVKIV